MAAEAHGQPVNQQFEFEDGSINRAAHGAQRVTSEDGSRLRRARGGPRKRLFSLDASLYAFLVPRELGWSVQKVAPARSLVPVSCRLGKSVEKPPSRPTCSNDSHSGSMSKIVAVCGSTGQQVPPEL